MKHEWFYLPLIFYLSPVKLLQVLLFNTNYSIQHYLFVRTSLNGSKYSYVSLTIQLNINHLFVVYSYGDSCRIHIDAIIKTSEDFFKKNIPLNLFERVGCMSRSWRPNRTAIYWPPLLWPSALCLSCSPGLLNRRPGGPAFCWVMAFSTASCHQQVSKLTDFLSSSSYIIVQSPTQYVWNGMFDRHQAEITVMQFAGHSLPMHQSMTVPWAFTSFNCV